MEDRTSVRSLVPILIILVLGCQSNNDKQEKEKQYQIKEIDVPILQDDKNWPASFDFGRKATKNEIEQLDISILPNGKGLPKGNGNALQGAVIFKEKCVSCHGATGKEGPFDKLVVDPNSKAKTIGNYWPYATTIFDYTRRAMPYNAPGSLSNQEVYQLTAYLLYANGIIGINENISASSLPKIEMPAKKLFVPDDRRGGPEVR